MNFPRTTWARRWAWSFACCLSLFDATARAQSFYERAPINYYTTPANDPVARLQKAIDAGQVTLEFDDQHGFLQSILKNLQVSPCTQTLVFSKTSFQRDRIAPRSPRALYFNDDVYVGWVQGGDVMEFSAVDPQLGAVFYTLEQAPPDNGKPRFIRDQGNCLSCHASSRTQDVPGHLVRSVYTAPGGMPHFGAGTFASNHSSPLSERWGGWYVTGTHGSQRHMGNVLATDKEHPEQLDTASGANLKSLSGLFNTQPYLTGHSDIVALMVLEHQVEMHNWLTRMNHDTRMALRDAAIMNEMMKRPADELTESAQRRIVNAAEKLVRYMLFLDEAPLSEPVAGTSDFADYFASLGPREAQGRSLRDFDLTRRMFKYPCSYLIYSAAFDGLPAQAKHFVYRRLHEILTGAATDEAYKHLSPADRQAILEILLATKHNLPENWRTTKAAAK